MSAGHVFSFVVLSRYSRANDFNDANKRSQTGSFEAAPNEKAIWVFLPCLSFRVSSVMVGTIRHTVDGEGYDCLDALLSGVLQIDEPAPAAEPAAEMVFYQPTPARHTFELNAHTGLGPHDVLIDLGSGLGHVPLLASICTGARCAGIEWQAAYVDCARRCAKALDLASVTFLRQDARAADLSAGTVFHLYTPFTGAMLADVLAMLRREAATREIRICALGPCTANFAREPWLEYVGMPKAGGLAVFWSVGL